MKISEEIKRLRINNGYTQNQMAEVLNVSRSTLAKWETGSSEPTVNDLIMLKKKFGFSIDKLLEEKDNVEEAHDASKWRNSSVVKILLLGLSFGLTFAGVLFDVSSVLNAKGNYAKIPFYVRSDFVRDLVLLVIDCIWIYTLWRKKDDVKCASLTVIEVYIGELITWFIEHFFINANGLQLATPMQIVYAVLRNGLLPLVCAISIIIYYKKDNYINPGVVILIYGTRIIEGTIGWSRSIYQNRNRLLYFDYGFIVGMLRWWNIVIIFTLFLYYALVLTKERRLKNKMQKNNRGGSIKA